MCVRINTCIVSVWAVATTSVSQRNSHKKASKLCQKVEYLVWFQLYIAVATKIQKNQSKIFFFIWYGCCIDIDAHLYNRNKEREKQVNIVISIWMIRQSRIHVYSKGGKNAIMNQNQNHLSHRNKITISSLCVQPATNTENNILWYTINKFVDLCAQTEKQRFIHEICDFLFLFIMNEWIRNQTLKCLYLLLLNGNRTNYWWSRSW